MTRGSKRLKDGTRKRILDRAGWRCETCRSDEPLQVHHLVTVSECIRTGRLPLIDDPANLVALCWGCHQEAHRVMGESGNWTAREWVKNRMARTVQ